MEQRKLLIPAAAQKEFGVFDIKGKCIILFQVGLIKNNTGTWEGMSFTSSNTTGFITIQGTSTYTGGDPNNYSIVQSIQINTPDVHTYWIYSTSNIFSVFMYNGSLGDYGPVTLDGYWTPQYHSGETYDGTIRPIDSDDILAPAEIDERFNVFIIDITGLGYTTDNWKDSPEYKRIRAGYNVYKDNDYNGTYPEYPITVSKKQFNLWDEKWENGIWYQGSKYTEGYEDYVCCKNKFRVKGETYYFYSNTSGAYDPYIGINFFDANGDWIVTYGVSNRQGFSTPRNACWAAFYINDTYGTKYTNDVVINEYFDGTCLRPVRTNSYSNGFDVDTRNSFNLTLYCGEVNHYAMSGQYSASEEGQYIRITCQIPAGKTGMYNFYNSGSQINQYIWPYPVYLMEGRMYVLYFKLDRCNPTRIDGLQLSQIQFADYTDWMAPARGLIEAAKQEATGYVQGWYYPHYKEATLRGINDYNHQLIWNRTYVSNRGAIKKADAIFYSFDTMQWTYADGGVWVSSDPAGHVVGAPDLYTTGPGWVDTYRIVPRIDMPDLTFALDTEGNLYFRCDSADPEDPSDLVTYLYDLGISLLDVSGDYSETMGYSTIIPKNADYAISSNGIELEVTPA